jgi:hypothetical protein
MKKVIIVLTILSGLAQPTDILGESQNNIAKKKPFTPKIVKIAIYAGLITAASQLPDKATSQYFSERNPTFNSFLKNTLTDFMGENKTPSISQFREYAQIVTWCIQGIFALCIFEESVGIIAEVEKRLTIVAED